MAETVTTNSGVDLPVLVKQSEDLSAENAALKARLSQAVMFKDSLHFQQYIEAPPVPKEALYGRACSGDSITTASWFQMWIDHTRYNDGKYHFAENSAMQEYGKAAMRPVICAGSGPSLKVNIDILQRRRKEHPEIMLVSCLHNYGYFLDNDIVADYYVNLDAGDVTIPELCHGGKKAVDYYWDATKDKVLIASSVSNPKLVDKWKGKILWFATVAPDNEFIQQNLAITKFNFTFSVGGNTLGAAMYFARAVLGCNPTVFIGADFSFSYDMHFHSFDTDYDKVLTGLVPVVDIFGNRRYSWPSYINFKSWIEYVAMGGKGNHPTLMINCTEGGILGAYPDGNLRCIQQMSLDDFYHTYCHYKCMPELAKQNQFTYLF